MLKMLKMLRKAKNVKKQAKDSRILELESWLCKARQGSYLSGSDRRLAAAIRDSSPKAESTSQKANAF